MIILPTDGQPNVVPLTYIVKTRQANQWPILAANEE